MALEWTAASWDPFRSCTPRGDWLLEGPVSGLVLAALAIEANRAVSSERLVELLWATMSPRAPARFCRRMWQTCARRSSRRRPLQGPSSQPVGCQLILPADAVEAHRFEQHLKLGVVSRVVV